MARAPVMLPLTRGPVNNVVEVRNPAEFLTGLVLDDGWRVLERISRPPRSTGGKFSIHYAVKSSNGTRAFLKALDYSSAWRQADAPRALQHMTSAYNYERDLLDRCASMSRVVTAIGHGQVLRAGWAHPVNYLVFEWADGDSRAVLDSISGFDDIWCLRTLHHTAVGLQQLHARRIAHQDVKPSNVLLFDGVGAKIADLGRSSYRGNMSPFDDLSFPGDMTYAPPEFLYGRISQDWVKRRMAADVYQLGSLVMFFFGGLGTTSALLAHLSPRHSPENWSGTFGEALPFVRKAFVESLTLMAMQIPELIRTEINTAVRELCDPDPDIRGHPKNRIGHQNPYGLERYVSLFDRLALKQRLGLRLGV